MRKFIVTGGSGFIGSHIIDKLINIKSYDEMLDQMIMSTRAEDMSKKERKDEGLSLNEILNNLDIRKWTDKDGKN